MVACRDFSQCGLEAENRIHGTDKPCLWLMSMSRYACCIVVVRETLLSDATYDVVERLDLG